MAIPLSPAGDADELSATLGALLRRLFARIRDLWLLALREQATPARIGASIAIGVVVGCTPPPLLGFHWLLAGGLATLFRVNRLWALIGSRISTLSFLPFLLFAEVQVGHHLRAGAWASFSLAELRALDARALVRRAAEYLVDWWIGMPFVGAGLAIALGGLGYAYVARRQAATPRTLAGSRRRPSESPP
jgi:uncharacterized protein (DUF2062 family)